jgi:phosphate starvation-inducible protein PhoH
MAQETFEEMPPDDYPEHQPGQNGHSNGNSPVPNSKRAGTGELFVGSEDSGFFELPKELLQASGNFDELMARGRVSDKELAAIIDMLTEDDQYHRGSIEPSRVAYLKLAGSIGVNGQARDEAIRAHTGGQNWKSNLMNPMDKIFGRGPQANGTGQREGPQ